MMVPSPTLDKQTLDRPTLEITNTRHKKHQTQQTLDTTNPRHNKLLLCLGFVMSRVCRVQGWSVQGLCLGLVMVLIIDYIRHFFQANTFTYKHTHTQTHPPIKTLFLLQKMPNSIFLVRKGCTLHLPPLPSPPPCKKD